MPFFRLLVDLPSKRATLVRPVRSCSRGSLSVLWWSFDPRSPNRNDLWLTSSVFRSSAIRLGDFQWLLARVEVRSQTPSVLSANRALHRGYETLSQPSRTRRWDRPTLFLMFAIASDHSRSILSVPRFVLLPIHHPRIHPQWKRTRGRPFPELVPRGSVRSLQRSVRLSSLRRIRLQCKIDLQSNKT